ncbi:MAG: galactose mutarotase, partial [Erysipelotrichaceae bacterium]|nr:galactose mutarotase [Erysipelotrichaceae bacterium]
MIYTIENEYLKAQVAELGATLVKLIDKASGQDLVLGFESEEEYLANSGPNLGATIGRNANRIGEARFKLNGREYKLSVNDNMNQLHGGGNKGFAFRMWKTEEVKDDQIVLSYL